MANTDPLGVTFLPSDDNLRRGLRRGNRESDLLEAFKILSLGMPRVPSTRAVAPPSLLNAPGVSAVPGGFNPHSAMFQQMLRTVLGRPGIGPPRIRL
jgi:hypothetical protein